MANIREQLVAFLRRRAWEIAAVGIGVVAAWLRLRDASHFLFGQDAARMLALAEKANEVGPALVGMESSKGLPNPPLSIWLLQPLMGLGEPALVATVLTALAQTAAVVLTFFVVRRYYGRPLAVAAMLLFATAPWPVYYARFLWQQNWLPLLSTALLGALLAWVVEQRPWMGMASVVLAALMLQLHLSGVAALAVVFAVAVLQRPPIRPRPALVAAGVVLLLFAPWVVGLFRQSGRLGSGSLFREFFVSPLVAVVESSGTWGLMKSLGIESDVFSGIVPGWLGATVVWSCGAVSAVGVVLALAWLCRDAWRRRGRRGLLPWLDDGTVQGVVVQTLPTVRWQAADTLLLFVLVPMAAYFLGGIHAQRHYVIALYPAIWMLVPWVLVRRWPRASMGAVGALAALQLLVTVRVQGLVADGRAPGAGVTWIEQQRAARFVCEHSGAAPVHLTGSPWTYVQVPANLTWQVDACGAAPAARGQRFLVVDESSAPVSKEALRGLKAKYPVYEGVGVVVAQQEDPW